MRVFKDKQLVEEMFGEIWTKMVNETEFGPKLKEGGISIYFVVNDPDVVMFVDENGPLFGEEAKAKIPVVTMKMSADNVHKFWLNKLNIPKALALRHIKAKGPVGKVLQVIPLLKPGKAMYPDYCKKFNLPMEI
jgi:putative sterol carrier protein